MTPGTRTFLSLVFGLALAYGIVTLGGATIMALAGEEEGLYQAYQVAALSACGMLAAIALAIMLRSGNNTSTPHPYPQQTHHHPQQHVHHPQQQAAQPQPHTAPQQAYGAPHSGPQPAYGAPAQPSATPPDGRGPGRHAG